MKKPLQVIVKSYGQHTYLSKTLKYSKHKFQAKVLCCKHYIFMYLDEYLTKPWLSAKEKK